jgi:two-component system cell cycle response regulator
MSNDESKDISEKTSVITSDTFKGRIQAADGAPPVIVVLIGPPGYVGKQYPIASNDIVIGRSVETQVYVDDKSLSRSHAKFAIVGAEVSIIDLGSTNKTIVNGNALAPLAPCKLKNNDQIKTGNIVFKFLEKGNIEALTNQTMYEKANRDALTGAHSKGSLLEKGPEAIKRSELLNEEMSVIVFDIYIFKKNHDSHGHAAGDVVLKDLANIVSSRLIRANDYFARYGGEEFVLILSGATAKMGSEIAERVRQTIEGHKFIYEGHTIPVTVSLGVVTKSTNDTDWSELFDRADKALYASKQGGRNRVTIAQ